MKTQVTIHVPFPPERCFALIEHPSTPSQCFSGFGPIPRTTESFLEDGTITKPGLVRVIRSADGSEIREQILSNDAPRLHAYQSIGTIPPPLGKLVRQIAGQWEVEPMDKGSSIRWTFSFAPTSALAAPIVWLLLHGFMRQAMKRCLKNLRRKL